MPRLKLLFTVVLLAACCASSTSAQQAQTATSTSTDSQQVVPTLVHFSGTLTDPTGKPLSGLVGVTFYLYQQQEGGSPVWLETQSVQLGKNGSYSVMLGSTSSEGLPTDVFASGQARWLSVQVQGQAEQPRVMLLSVPYALKAGDAQTIGGLPASAFVKANQNGHSSGSKGKAGIETQNYIPLFIDGSGDLGNSILYQLGSTEVGIGTTTPAATLEVAGTGKFDSLVSFASGQTFPGTVTGVKAGTGISITGTATDPTVGINTTFANEFYAQLKAPNTFTANQTVNGTLTATNFSGNGSGLTNVNASELGGVGLSNIPQLNAANTFTANNLFEATMQANQVLSPNVDSTVDVATDINGTNKGSLSPGLRLGSLTGGEGISSARPNGSPNQYGVDFYTNYTNRMSITNGGFVGIGTNNPQMTLDVSNGIAIVRGLGNFQNAGQTAVVNVGDTNHAVWAQNASGINLQAFNSQPLLVEDNSGFAYATAFIPYFLPGSATNIQTLDGALEKVEQLRGASYDAKDTGKHQIGLIPEEVGKVVPEVVAWEKDGKNAKGIDYARLTALLIEAVKEQQKLVQEQKQQLKVQQTQISQLTSQVKTIQTALHNSQSYGSTVLAAEVSTPSIRH